MNLTNEIFGGSDGIQVA